MKPKTRELYVKVPLPTEVVEAIEGHVEGVVRIAGLIGDLVKLGQQLHGDGVRAAVAIERDVDRVRKAIRKRPTGSRGRKRGRTRAG